MHVRYCKFISWQKIGETVFVINENTKQMYYFDSIATDFWIQMGICGNMDLMIESIIQMYDISKEEAVNDIKDFLLYLKDENLIVED